MKQFLFLFLPCHFESNHFVCFFIPAEPKNLNISTTDGRDISSSSIIGPFHEGYELRLTCESGGGKPIPRVTWYNGSNVISGKFKKINQNMQN